MIALFYCSNYNILNCSISFRVRIAQIYLPLSKLRFLPVVCPFNHLFGCCSVCCFDDFELAVCEVLYNSSLIITFLTTENNATALKADIFRLGDV